MERNFADQKLNGPIALPFVTLSQAIIRRLIELEHFFLVCQTYEDFPISSEPALLFTDYQDLGLAKVHHAALAGDRFACICYLSNPKHLERLDQMILEKKYACFFSAVPSVRRFEHDVKKIFSQPIRRYLQLENVWADVAQGSVRAKIHLIFGRLYFVLRRRGEELRIKLSDLRGY